LFAHLTHIVLQKSKNILTCRDVFPSEERFFTSHFLPQKVALSHLKNLLKMALEDVLFMDEAVQKRNPLGRGSSIERNPLDGNQRVLNADSCQD
jgi:hypothetical protein